MENIGDIHLSPAQSCHFKEPESHVRTWLCSQTGILPSQYTNLAVDKVVSPHADSVSPRVCVTWIYRSQYIQLTSSITATLDAMQCTSTCSQLVIIKSLYPEVMF